jgi:hypothetical protein
MKLLTSKWVWGGAVLGGLATAAAAMYLNVETGVIKYDQEHQKDGAVLNPSTQSINRYFSDLRDLAKVLVDVEENDEKISITLLSEQQDKKLHVDNIDLHYIVPLLPYPHDKSPDDFDKANLMLGEYARNGVSMSFQESNNKFGVFNASDDLFSSDEEYIYKAGQIMPNSGVRPKRFSVTNNCLKPGLWELAATDSVGEMYHGWFNLDKGVYYKMIRLANNIEISDLGLMMSLRYKKDISDVEVRLDRLRESGKVFHEGPAVFNMNKKLGSYSSQDSRRKAQKGYFQIIRDNEVQSLDSFADLKEGDEFKMHKFVPPGVYSSSEDERVPFDPDWTSVVIKEVTPKTEYPGGIEERDPFGYVEITLLKGDGSTAFVAGNVPLSLLVFQDDYRIPAFGVGVLPSSERMEQRFLRISEGPVPHYAYQMIREDGRWNMVNNHESGYEQIYLRPFERDGHVYLRMTIVSYERIVDLIEVEIKIDGELSEVLRQASNNYKPPLFRVYRDDNIL